MECGEAAWLGPQAFFSPQQYATATTAAAATANAGNWDTAIFKNESEATACSALELGLELHSVPTHECQGIGPMWRVRHETRI